jgi:prepilin peptidase CpaA
MVRAVGIMSSYQLTMLAPMLALLVWAAAVDLRSRRIPNWLTLTLVVSGLLQSLIFHSHITVSEAGLGLLVGLGLTFLPFALGAMGGGDVKLMAGVGAWLGAMAVFQVFLVAAVVGLVIVLAQCSQQGRLAVLLRNSSVLVFSIMHLNELGVEHVSETGKASRSVDRPLPYAVPVLAAVLLLIAVQ